MRTSLSSPSDQGARRPAAKAQNTVARLAGLSTAAVAGAALWAAAAVGPARAQVPIPAAPPAACAPLLKHQFLRLQDEVPQSLCQYSGKVLVVVNTASFCGFTGQYAGLEALYSRYQGRGLVVLGFPSNDFSQESGSNKDIAAFCSNTFGVKFPMFVKSSVSGNAANPLYQQLAAATGKAPRWNFHKYVVGRDGKVAGSFDSSVDPLDARMVQAIEKQLLVK
jgi:glutathione peroxidase